MNVTDVIQYAKLLTETRAHSADLYMAGSAGKEAAFDQLLDDLADALAAPDAYEAVLLRQKIWVQHWMDDVAAGLKPTPESLTKALADLDAALIASRQPTSGDR